jgi:hypothetical protein
LGQVFNCKIGRFADEKAVQSLFTRPSLELKSWLNMCQSLPMYAFC